MSLSGRQPFRLLGILWALVALSLVLLILVIVIFIGWQSLGNAGYLPARFAGSNVATTRPITPRGNLAESERTTIQLFEAASPSVVFITSLEVKRDFFSFDVFQIPRGNGSGFVWDKQGHIITNLHVLLNADAARVTLADGSTYPARLIGQAADKDLAVLKIAAPADKLRPLAVGRSRDLKVGQSVFAIGNPFGLDQTLSVGVIGGLGREMPALSGGTIAGVIQTDAAINPGNSGGPLLDSAGRLIGVNTAIYSPTGSNAGIGFAIPVDMVNLAVPQLISHGRIIRPRLGVHVADDSLARRLGLKGVLVLGVESGSPAERAGVRGTVRGAGGMIVLGDLIVGMDSEPIEDMNDLFQKLERHVAGDKVVLQIRREGSRMDVKVELAPGS